LDFLIFWLFYVLLFLGLVWVEKELMSLRAKRGNPSFTVFIDSHLRGNDGMRTLK
jgi:hypothetical protein